MGLVFVALLAFLLIMLLLQKLFPDEEVQPDEVGDGGGFATGEVASVGQAVEVQTLDGLAGAQIAAMAVALYMSMEDEESGEHSDRQEGEDVAVTAPAAAPTEPPAASNWTLRGRTALMESQSRRPPPFGQKLHSGYSQRDESR